MLTRDNFTEKRIRELQSSSKRDPALDFDGGILELDNPYFKNKILFVTNNNM